MPQKSKISRDYQKTIITPATIQRAIYDAKLQLTDKDIFLSPAYHRQLQVMGKYLTGRTGRKDIQLNAKVIWKEGPDAVTAYTDNTSVVINAAHPIIQALPHRPERNFCVLGMANHEFAHCLFTDFSLMNEQQKAYESGEIFPRKHQITPENERGLKELQKVLDKGPGARCQITNLYNWLDNTIEDAYIERSIVRLHPGDTKKSLKILNNAFFGEDYMEVIQNHSYLLNMPWTLFSNATLILLKTGHVHIDPSAHEVLKDIYGRLKRIAPRLLREAENSNAMARKELALDLITENWDLLEKQFHFDEMTEGSEGQPIPGEGEASQESQGNSSSGSTNQQQNGLDSLSDEEISEILSEILENALKGLNQPDPNGQDPNGGRPIKVFDEKPSPSEEQDEGGSSDADEKSDSSEGSGTATGVPEDSDDSENTSESTSIELGDEDNSHTGADGSFDLILTNIEKELAQENANNAVEQQLKNTLQLNADASAEGDSFQITISRESQYPQKGAERYAEVWPKISSISKSLKKQLLKILRDRRTGTKQTGLIYGRRLDTRSLYRSDEKYFYKNRIPNDRPQLATALLIDQSGSMSCSARDSSGQQLFRNKIQAASNAAVLLYDFCVELGFPIMVAGHTTSGIHKVQLEVMSAFQKVDKTDRFRICGATASGGNRDGTALNYMLSELKKRPEDIKLLFIVSDGLPSDYSSREEGINHLKNVMEDARKSGVLVFAAALDEDIPQLREIYGDTMFEITDLARMPKTLLTVMKKFVR